MIKFYEVGQSDLKIQHTGFNVCHGDLNRVENLFDNIDQMVKDNTIREVEQTHSPRWGSAVWAVDFDNRTAELFSSDYDSSD
ncbi:MAG: hypothetical protein RLY43_2148 [Bacteroidota bacterium]|jgi:hypothetical protein